MFENSFLMRVLVSALFVLAGAVLVGAIEIADAVRDGASVMAERSGTSGLAVPNVIGWLLILGGLGGIFAGPMARASALQDQIRSSRASKR